MRAIAILQWQTDKRPVVLYKPRLNLEVTYIRILFEHFETLNIEIKRKA